MNPPQSILRSLMRTAPFQPATNLWRAVELDALQRRGLPGGRGLDLGCGDGKLTRILVDAIGPEAQRIEWVGVDIDPGETALAAAEGLYRRVHTGSAASIPEPDASFDFVLSNSVLEHIGPIDAVLAEAARLLRPGGQLIATVPGPDFHACLAGPRFGGSHRRAAYDQEIDTRCAHLRYWDRGEWLRHLAGCGLELLSATSYLTAQQTRRWERLSAWTGGLAYRLFGARARPIEIQRRMRLRRRSAGLAGHVGAAAAPLLAWGCPLDAQGTADRFACLLIHAVKP